MSAVAAALAPITPCTVNLRQYTTLALGGQAQWVAITHLAEAQAAVAQAHVQQIPLTVLGGGSNVIVPDGPFPGWVLHPSLSPTLPNITPVHSTTTHVTLRAHAGVVWDDFVAHAVAAGLWGVENLSLIPGHVGGAPVQNIEAYGQELASTLTTVHALDLPTNTPCTLAAADCAFGYRRSRFNTTDRGRYLILAVDFTLARIGTPNLRYKDLADWFAPQLQAGQTPALAAVRAAVVAIRQQKLHDPAQVGNVGSFFKNPTLPRDIYEKLCATWGATLSPDQQARLAEFGTRFAGPQGVKVPAGFLIEACGLRGYQMGGAQVSPRHALVLINATGQATAADVITLAQHIIATVRTHTHITLVPEPNFLGFSPTDLGGLNP